jgi:uncharacterized protein YdcH (DUF465 family)
MPISTPSDQLHAYDNDDAHFKRVLEHLFIPAIAETGYLPISPSVTGSDVVHAKIISNLSSSDLVLCDMSALNPNVFFELGIRTAVNKPVCLVKDDVTSHVPFDASIVSYHTYVSKLMAWNIDEQRTLLKHHIENTINKESTTNAMWSYFSLTHTAHLSTEKKVEDARFEHLARQIEQVAKRVEARQNEPQAKSVPALGSSPASSLPDILQSFCQNEGIKEEELARRLGIRSEVLEGLRTGEVVPSPALELKILSLASRGSGSTE